MNDNSIKINDNTLSVESWIEQPTVRNDENEKENLNQRNKEAKHNDSESRAEKKISKNKEDLKRQDENDSEIAIKKEINQINEGANCTNSDTTKDYTIIVPPRKKMRNMTEEEVEGGSQTGGKVKGEGSFMPSVNGHSSEQEYITESLQSSSFNLKRKKKKLKKKNICESSKGEENDEGEKSGKNKSKRKKRPKGKNAQCEKYDQMADQSSNEGGTGDSSEENSQGRNDGSSGEDDLSNSLPKKKGKKMDKQKIRNMLREKLNKTKKMNFKKEKNNLKNEKQKYAKYKRNKENIKMTFDVTSRFTVLGCDWDNISSADIFYLFESYYNFEKRKKKNIDYTKSRAVKKVTIYTSKYGEKKLKQEKKHGPKINLDILKMKRKGDGAVYRQNNFLDYFQEEEEEDDDDNDSANDDDGDDDNDNANDNDDDENVNENEEGALNSSGHSDSDSSRDAEGSVNNDESVESDGSADSDDSEDRDDSTGDDESSDSDSSAGEDAKGKKGKSDGRDSSKAKLKKKENEQAILHSSLSADEEEENEKIRLYQIQRSRYYFAVVECYNKEIVEFLYEELNDMDADFCINYLDLRIIDDECSLDDYKVKETCSKIPDNYQFHYSVSTPLKHTHAKSTWDENPKRKKLLSTRFSEEKLRELDLKEYLANSSSSDEEEQNEQGQNHNKDNSPLNKREKDNREYYRKLLLGDWLNDDDTENAQKEEPNRRMEKTSGKGTRENDVSKMNFSMYMDEMDEDLEDKEGIINFSKEGILSSNKNARGSITNELAENHHEKGGEKIKRKAKSIATASAVDDADDSDNENEVVTVFKNMLKNKDQKEEKKSPWDKYLDRVKQKKKLKKKAYLESLKKKDEEIKKIITKKTNKRKKDVMFKSHGENLLDKVNDGHVIDSRFADLYKNKDFNLDITNPNFKKTKFNEEILQKKKL
ncbi:small subunit rRNA processing factor, putative [Plasmodium knowlesi strain H]|uniref:Small subunit rRNA processing factor, putative n=3 Tax=Plasmodium knowlesi TaxID=5850 RepID=A0A5K1VPH0_PLAKH|nr:uncharacterized protein PKNH_1307100 [Plasmodium knowlesi strain H]OTN66543.1 putative Small subunit rRNA processing factor [Plasmodium knowlesi]CAA9990110.1 pre-rRNA-processing protein ESF1, putative [Plasmodium knowlesi strain H]SBO25788.1 small subunit rRNA processing factor, putative [Plasmodium knowlesi strain H]SBO28583.1 small subunit rRNA processing factor, putative [Plasmodium knowlesi strain H]VVS79584.1 pre-rRNA-processing protein ESF1, putative [Plasmodium knowlesi strain H]|eukprot:XP_002260577.1 [Plasmodium knowlesi strain H]